MCGIAGIVSHAEAEIPGALTRAHNVQGHRGPDGSGSVVRHVGDWFVGLAHERLAIIDLSSAGSQPMQSVNGRHWLSYNGEVYNFVELRAELSALGCSFTGTSDTEVILAALMTWGEAAMTRFNGMWAFAWLDLDRRRLVLSRDRMGVKPLYYRKLPGGLAFASEIKALLEIGGEPLALDMQVVGAYLSQSLLDISEDTFFRGVTKVGAATYCVVDLASTDLAMRVHRFWEPQVTELALSMRQAAERVRELFLDAVRIRLRSDVPVGVLLSGGVDSSAIAGCMDELLGPEANLNLLSAVSDGGRFDESPFIDRMARFLNRPVQKIRIDVEPGSAMKLLDEVCWYNDEPVGSFANAAHFLLMKRAREIGVTVILSGQGADEIFCGYKKFVGFQAIRLARDGRWLQALRLLGGFLRRGTVLNQFTMHEAKRYLPAVIRPSSRPVLGPALADFRPVTVGLGPDETLRERQISDLTRFSVPILTHYEDRSSMAWGREVRTPFLDYRLVETALALPASLKLSGGWTKRALREAVADLVPPEIAWRKDKQGFVNPQSEWLKHELRPVVTEVIEGDSRIFRMGILDRGGLAEKYSTYCRQPADGGSVSFKEIFQPVALEIWLRRYAPYIRD